MIAQAEMWWGDLGEPTGSAPGYRRPLPIVQGDALNRSLLATIMCVPLTGNLRYANAPGNVLLRASVTGLTQDSVAIVSQIVTVDKKTLEERAGWIDRRSLELVFTGIDTVLGR